jgi:Amt family ammonium transporter
MPLAMPGHQATLVMCGCLVSLPGWIALNAAAAMLFSGAEPGHVVLIAINTIVAAGSAALATALVTRLRFGKPDASLTANGWISGIAAVSAGSAFLPAVSAIIVGLFVGLIAPLSVEFLELRLNIDDPGGSVSVHAVGGLWGIFAVALIGRLPGAAAGQFMAQLVGAATLIGCILPLAYALNWLLAFAIPYRASPESERQGLDLSELGAGAYPEFMTHADEFMQR